MIDALLNVAVFAALVLCIVGFGAWARQELAAGPRLCRIKRGQSSSDGRAAPSGGMVSLAGRRMR